MAMQWELDRHCLSAAEFNLTCSNHQHKFFGQHWKRCKLGARLNFAIIFQCPKTLVSKGAAPRLGFGNPNPTLTIKSRD